MGDPQPVASGGTLEAWRSHIQRQRRDMYWPGPWRIGEAAEKQLIGRDADIEKLRYAIFDRNLVVLSGDSGVGKSSLLGAGIIPGLKRDGFVVAVCDNWSGRHGPDVEEAGVDATANFLAEKLASDLGRQGISLDEAGSDGAAFVDYLNEAYGSHAVIVLDQFEELIRQQPELYWSVRQWVERVVDETRVRVVISLRAEYAHHLVDLDVSPYRRLDWVVDPIRDGQSIEDIVRSGQAPTGEAEASSLNTVIDDDAVARVCELWAEAGGQDGSSRVRLLHLQAALFVLWDEDRGRSVSAETVDRHHQQAREWWSSRQGKDGVRTTRDAVAYFDWAITRVVAIHLELCRTALEATMPGGFRDAFLEEGALSSVVRMAEYLSSGGYKVDQDRVHLGHLVLAGELRALGYHAGDTDLIERFASDVVDAFGAGGDFDWISAPGVELRKKLRVTRQESGSRTVGAGPMMGLPADAVLVEECRRFFFALEWLSIGELIRLSPSDRGKVVALSHDGFGRGLTEWADQYASRPQTALTRLTESRGDVFEWETPTAEASPLVAEPGAYIRHTNLRWRSCRVVGARFERVVFFACDFRGTSFANCTFQGVTFVNCILDGVQFDECTIVGGPTRLENEQADGIRADRRAPSFIDPEPMDQVDSHDALMRWSAADTELAVYNHYRNDPVEGATVMYSETAGVEAVPAKYLVTTQDTVLVLESGEAVEREMPVSHVKTRSDDDVPVTARWESQRGGLTMFGGRLSSLAFYGCRFVRSDGPATDVTPGVSLRHVAGTSLDFFELDASGGYVGLYDAAVRGLSISSRMPEEVRRVWEPRAKAEFQALECHLENVWFSTGLQGSAWIGKSVVWQLFNANPRDEFQVNLDEDTPYGGVVNVLDAGETFGIDALQRGFTTTSLGLVSLDDVERFANAIDYRSSDEARRWTRSEETGDV